MKGGVELKNSKLFQALLLITVCLVFVYMFFIHNMANTKPVSAYVDDGMYQVYTGKNIKPSILTIGK